MALCTPEIQKINERMQADPNFDNMAVKYRYQAEMMATFKKHKCNPGKSLLLPIIQLPVFMSFFFGLKTAGEYLPGFAEGGTGWFQNLSAADPTYLFPIFTSLSMLGMFELGADGMNPANKEKYKWVFRGVSLMLLPVSIDLPAAVFLYWTTSNMFALGQTMLFRSPDMRKKFDMPPLTVQQALSTQAQEQAKATPNPFKSVIDIFRKDKQLREAAKHEILDGGKAVRAPSTVQVAEVADRKTGSAGAGGVPPPPPPTGGASTVEKVKTYRLPPTAGKKRK